MLSKKQIRKSHSARYMFADTIRPGDFVIYRVKTRSVRPRDIQYKVLTTTHHVLDTETAHYHPIEQGLSDADRVTASVEYPDGSVSERRWDKPAVGNFPPVEVLRPDETGFKTPKKRWDLSASGFAEPAET